MVLFTVTGYVKAALGLDDNQADTETVNACPPRYIGLQCTALGKTIFFCPLVGTPRESALGAGALGLVTAGQQSGAGVGPTEQNGQKGRGGSPIPTGPATRARVTESPSSPGLQ